MRHDSGQFARNRPIDIFHDHKVGRKEDIKISLMDLKSVSGHSQ